MTQEFHSACYKKYLSNNHFQRKNELIFHSSIVKTGIFPGCYRILEFWRTWLLWVVVIHESGSMKCKSHTIKKGSDKAIKGFLTMRKENVKHHVGCKMKWQRHICDGLCTSAATIFSCIAKFDESAFLIWQMLFQ